MSLQVPAYPGSPGQKAVKRLCVCVCVSSLDSYFLNQMLYFVKIQAFR